ncbi:MAG: GtrA family protein [Nanoarchaeota archaeon]
MTTPGLLKSRTFYQFIKFGLVGVESTILNYFVFILLLLFFDIYYLLAAACGFIIGVLFGFFFNEALTFDSNRTKTSSFFFYILVYLISLTINLLFLRFLVENGGMNQIAANVLLAPFIIIINFFGAKIIAFKDKKW